MSEFLPAEKGMTIRQASTANFQINSLDRSSGTSSDFQIVRPESLLNGFFTRLGAVEVVLNWSVPNVSVDASNNLFKFIFNGTPYTAVVPTGSYQFVDLVSAVAKAMGIATGNGEGYFATISGLNYAPSAGITGLQPYTYIYKVNAGAAPSPDTLTFVSTTLSAQMGAKNVLMAGTQQYLAIVFKNPVVLPVKYLDFVCSQLTYAQDLKDATTGIRNRDVLYRWNLAWDDTGNISDTAGYTIYQGYNTFISRRYLAFPKQIRWDNTLPVGNLTFQVYTDTGKLVSDFIKTEGSFEWSMNLLVSEN